MEEIVITNEDSFILGNFDEKESFTMQMHNIGPVHVMNMISHLAVALETKEGITIEETAERLVEQQANFIQEVEA